jgi:DNA recombination-dependent growth factor C
MASLLRGNTGFLRYSIAGELPAINPLGFITERLQSHTFRDIDDNFEELSIGWTSIFDMLGPDFTDNNHIAGDNLVFTLRIDERKVPPATLKKFCQKEEARIKEARQIPKLSKAHRVEIKESVRLMLTKKTAPAPTVVDVCWSLTDNTVFFFSTSTKLQEIFESLFKITFDIAAVLEPPFVCAKRLLPPERHAALEALTPSLFTA